MRKLFTCFWLLLVFLVLGKQSYGQLNYLPGGFTTAVGTYLDLGSSGNVISVPNMDDAFSAPLPIGFTFNFNGAAYDSFTFSTNGFIKLGVDTASRHYLFTNHAQPPPNGPFTAATSPTPAAKDSSMLFAFGQDLFPGTNTAEFRYNISGSSGSQVCTIQWKNVKDKTQASVGGLWDTINFQIRLYETSNVIEYVYGKWTSTVSLAAARFSAVGIVGKSVVTANQNLHLVKGSTVSWGGSVANTGFYVNNAVNYRNPTSTPAGPAPENGRTYTFTPIVLNDASVRAVYAQGRVALPFYLPDSIRANISNNGVNALTGLTVTLSISGTNTYTATATIASLAPNGNATVSFPPFYPTNTGANLITVSVPTDDNPANNVKLYSMSISNNRNGYTDTLVPLSGSNGTTIPHFWGCKYFIPGTGLVTQVRSPLVANSDAVGDTVCGMVMDSLGLILARSPNYIVQTSDLGTVLVFNMVAPAVVSNQSIIVGIAGGQTINSLNYFLGTSQTENPMRPNTICYFMTQTAAGGVTNANVGLTYANPVAWATTRLMMECTVDPLPPIDVGVSASGPNAAVKIPTNTAIPIRAVVKNFGTQVRSSGIQVRYSVNGGALIGPVNTTVSLNPGDTTSVLFSGTNALTVATAGTYTLKIFTNLAGDGLRSNDTLTAVYNAVPTNTLPYRITNNILSSWTTIGNTPAIWKEKVAIQSNGLAGSNVLFADNIITPATREAFVISPPISLSGTTNPVLHFNMAHAPNTFTGTDDTLQVLISTNGGLNYTSLFLRSSQFSSPTLGTDTPTSASYNPAFAVDWRHESVNLSAFAGNPYVVIAFRDRSASGNSIFVGNVSISNALNTSTQGVSSAGTYSSGNVSIIFSSIGNANGELNFARYNSAPFSSASPVFITNTTATTNNASIFTPNNVSQSHTYSITYSGIGTGNYPQSVQYSLNFDLTGVPGISSKDSLYLLRRSDYNASWVPVSTNVSGSNLYTSSLTGFSDFTLGSVSSVNPLPVTWLSFSGLNLDPFHNQLIWKTASEINCDYFSIERSEENNAFVEVGLVKAKGKENQVQQYAFVDKLTQPFEKAIQYRIKQVDIDGKFSYSKTISISPAGLAMDSEIKITNPFEGVPIIWINQANAAAEYELTLMDMSGRLVQKKTVSLNEGNHSISLDDLANCNGGVYLLTIHSNGEKIRSEKILKLN